VRRVVNMSAIACVEAQIRAPREVAKRKVRAKARHDAAARKTGIARPVKKPARTNESRSKR
jgi:hypothetical protein